MDRFDDKFRSDPCVYNDYQVFEENRLTYIRSRSDIKEWFYIPTDQNPADLPSRGCLPHEIVGNELWTQGPKCVHEKDFDNSSFEKPLQSCCEEDNDPCLKKNQLKKSENSMFNEEIMSKHAPNIGQLIDITKFNDIQKLLRVTAYMLKFAYRNKDFGELNRYEYSRKLWIINEQKADEMRNPDFQKIKANLRIYVENGIMRCRGRLSNSYLPYDTKFPIYIPRESHLGKLLITVAHESVFHQKERATLTAIRTNYWIPQGRKLIRNLLPKCYLCRRMETVACSLPPPPPLPKYRVEMSPPFSNIGLDHMGPIWVYDIFNKKDAHKAYVALFTCCTTRMIHLELQPSLDAATTIRSLKRTFSRVGYPKRVISDNHKTFRSTELRQFAQNNSIDWKYILELSPHWGGFYERLNGLVKTALRKNLWKSKLNYEQIDTILIEIEGVLNARPLCYVDDSDLCEPITPSHLTFGRNIGKINLLDSTTDVNENPNPSARVKHVKTLLDHFWQRFSSEYICGLRERDIKKKRNDKTYTAVKEGDVVMIQQKHVARSTWPLGKVTRLVKSADGFIRGAELQTSNGTIKRPVNLLYSLELS